jgi:hypothetical protein
MWAAQALNVVMPDPERVHCASPIQTVAHARQTNSIRLPMAAQDRRMIRLLEPMPDYQRGYPSGTARERFDLAAAGPDRHHRH